MRYSVNMVLKSCKGDSRCLNCTVLSVQGKRGYSEQYLSLNCPSWLLPLIGQILITLQNKHFRVYISHISSTHFLLRKWCLIRSSLPEFNQIHTKRKSFYKIIFYVGIMIIFKFISIIAKIMFFFRRNSRWHEVHTIHNIFGELIRIQSANGMYLS